MPSAILARRHALLIIDNLYPSTDPLVFPSPVKSFSLKKHDVVDASTNCETGFCFIFFLFFGLHSCGACYRACLPPMSSSLLRWNRLRLLNLLSPQSLQIDRACKLDMNLAEMKQVQKFAHAPELQRTASRALSTQFGGCFVMSFFMSWSTSEFRAHIDLQFCAR